MYKLVKQLDFDKLVKIIKYKKAKRTWAELSKESKINKSAFLRIIGKKEVGLLNLVRFCNYLDIEVSELYLFEENEEEKVLIDKRQLLLNFNKSSDLSSEKQLYLQLNWSDNQSYISEQENNKKQKILKKKIVI